MKKEKVIIALSIIATLVIARLLPHPYNFTPVGALAIFLGAKYSKGFFAPLILLAALIISDIFVNGFLYDLWSVKYFASFGVWIHYAAFMSYLFVGKFLSSKTNGLNLGLGSAFSSILFFIISNFLVFAFGNMYPINTNGLVLCYTLAIPFLNNMFAGDLLFTYLIFGIYSLAKSHSLNFKLDN